MPYSASGQSIAAMDRPASASASTYALYNAGDRAAVVLDIGHKYTKCGFSGEGVPRQIWETRFTTSDGQHLALTRSIGDEIYSERAWEEAVELYLHNIFYNVLQITPTSRKVVICESFLFPESLRRVLAKVLFQRFRVPSLSLLPSILLCLLPVQRRTGIVIDAGYTGTVVCPVVDGCALLHAKVIAHAGGHSLSRSLWNTVKEKGQIIPSSAYASQKVSKEEEERQLRHAVGVMQLIHARVRPRAPHLRSALTVLAAMGGMDMKVMEDQLALIEMEERRQKSGEGRKNLTVPLDRFGKLLALPEECVEEIVADVVAGEQDTALSSGEQDGEVRGKGKERDAAPTSRGGATVRRPRTGVAVTDSIAEAVVESLLLCDIDVRVVLAQNIVFAGGLCEVQGLRLRVLLECVQLMTQGVRYGPLTGLVGDLAPIDARPHRASTLAWTGGAIAGALDNVASIYQSDYLAALEDTSPSPSSKSSSEPSQSSSPSSQPPSPSMKASFKTLMLPDWASTDHKSVQLFAEKEEEDIPPIWQSTSLGSVKQVVEEV